MNRSLVLELLLSLLLLLLTMAMLVLSNPLLLPAVLPPSVDPFYTPPAGFENQPAGTILKSRSFPASALKSFASSFPDNLHAAYQFLYRTNDALGQPITTVTTLLEPNQPDRTKLVSYQSATDSAQVDCFPSFTLQLPLSQNPYEPSMTPLDVQFLDSLLSHHYYVNVADYEGSKGMFLVGAMSGHAVLDSLRASIKYLQPPSTVEQEQQQQQQQQEDILVQLWGYSGGAFATGWAVELVTTYAPELNIIGASLGGTPSDFLATYIAVDAGPFSGLTPSALIGLSRQYSEMGTYLNRTLLPEKKEQFWEIGQLCKSHYLITFAFERLDSYFTNPAWFLRDPVIFEPIHQNTLGKTDRAPTIPLLMYHAVYDEVIPIQETIDLYTRWCAYHGQPSIQFIRDELSEHVTIEMTAATLALEFIHERFSNKTAVQAGCSTRSILSTISFSSTKDGSSWYR